jgi:protein involved in polysaccharide export with SLBB domain
VTHSQLETKVTKAVKTIYTDNVQVYTQLQGTQPVGVFVTGFVNVPGKYAGTPNDSILYFLHQANGIDKERGSFRKVKVIRDDKEVAQLDLYDFVLSGRLPKIQFQEGDTVVVERRGKTIDVVNADKIIEKFEIAKAKVNGGSFLDYYPLKADISHALIKGARQGKPFSDYVSLAKFQEYPLDKDDQVMFMADEQAQSIVVQLEGSYLGKSYFVVPKTTTLQELLDNVAVQPELTDIDSISIRRLSVAQKQKEALLASLDRLENVYLTANSSTAEEASIRIKEAELIQGFVSRASKVEPNGRLVVATKDGVADVGLQDGDVVTIPAKSESVLISGQVLVPRTIVFQEGLTIEDYIKLSGGFTEQADEEKIVVIRQSGEVIADATAVIKPGDQILVLPEVPTKNIQLATSITQILYQIAIAAKVAFDL